MKYNLYCLYHKLVNFNNLSIGKLVFNSSTFYIIDLDYFRLIIF